MSLTIPTSAPRGMSLRERYDEKRIGDTVLYDITVQAATSLSSLFVKRQLTAATEQDREHWAARARLVERQRAALNPGDRAELIAQQEAWLEEIENLAGRNA